MTAGTVSRPVLLDSSAWLEYLTLDEKAEAVAPYIEGLRPVLVPTIVMYEVYKKLRMGSGKAEADQFASQAMRRKMIPLDEELALAAVSVSLDHKLAMADAIIYATALISQAELVTSDQAFAGLPGVTLF